MVLPLTNLWQRTKTSVTYSPPVLQNDNTLHPLYYVGPPSNLSAPRRTFPGADSSTLTTGSGVVEESLSLSSRRKRFGFIFVAQLLYWVPNWELSCASRAWRGVFCWDKDSFTGRWTLDLLAFSLSYNLFIDLIIFIDFPCFMGDWSRWCRRITMTLVL